MKTYDTTTKRRIRVLFYARHPLQSTGLRHSKRYGRRVRAVYPTQCRRTALGKNYPDYWLFQYTIPDDVLLRIRQQERLIGPDFLQNSLPILLEEGVAPQRIVRLLDAAFAGR